MKPFALVLWMLGWPFLCSIYEYLFILTKQELKPHPNSFGAFVVIVWIIGTVIVWWSK